MEVNFNFREKRNSTKKLMYREMIEMITNSQIFIRQNLNWNGIKLPCFRHLETDGRSKAPKIKNTRDILVRETVSIACEAYHFQRVAWAIKYAVLKPSICQGQTEGHAASIGTYFLSNQCTQLWENILCHVVWLHAEGFIKLCHLVFFFNLKKFFLMNYNVSD